MVVVGGGCEEPGVAGVKQVICPSIKSIEEEECHCGIRRKLVTADSQFNKCMWCELGLNTKHMKQVFLV